MKSTESTLGLFYVKHVRVERSFRSVRFFPAAHPQRKNPGTQRMKASSEWLGDHRQSLGKGWRAGYRLRGIEPSRTSQVPQRTSQPVP